METARGQLEERVAVMTGASSGLGRATALELAAAGADVALLARSVAQLAEVAREVEARGRRALPIPIHLPTARHWRRRWLRSKSGSAASTCS
jgi:NAD(P)-dependent dehydrogenase (short-subunit alcohol dehydrogenase family)